MSEAVTIYRYRQLTPFTTQGSGTAQWCVGEWNDRPYFIKEFLSPTLPPADADPDSPVTRSRRDACITFYHAKKRLYQTLQAVNNGCLICPDSDDSLFVFEGHYVAVSPFITPDVKPEAICTLTPHERLVLMRTLMLSMSGIHEAGIVHSDVKLDNLMVTRNATGAPNLKLIDFDSAFFLDTPPASPEEIHGDFVYLAPETLACLDGEPIRLTDKIDIFALGLVLHQMGCGELPRFDGSLYKCAGEAALDGSPVTPVPSLPPPLRAIIAAMLHPDPAARPSARQVYDQLGLLLFPQADQAVTDVPPPPPAESPVIPAPEESPDPLPPSRPVPEALAPPPVSRPALAPDAKRKDRGGLVLAAAAIVLLLSAVILILFIIGR